MPKNISALGFALIIVIGVILFRNANLNTGSKEASPSANIASSSASISPTPTPKPRLIPANYGKSVNVPILYYHYIGLNPNPEDKARDSLSIAPDKFDEQLGYLSSAGYTPITLDTMYAALKGNIGLPARPIVLTFDDGYVDFYVNAFPILRKYNFHAVSFIPTGLIGTSFYMHWTQIKEIDANGLVSFQAHSVKHPNLTLLSDQELHSEISQSKIDLESQLGKPVNFFAYPFGISDERVWEVTRQAGFLGAVGTWGGRIESEGNIIDMPRMRVNGSWTLTEFKNSLGL